MYNQTNTSAGPDGSGFVVKNVTGDCTMRRRISAITATALFIVIASVVSGCATGRVNLVDAGVVTLEKQAAGKVYVAWSSAHECEDGLVITGVLRRSDRTGSPIRAHVDVTVISPDGRVVNTACSNHVYVPRRRTGRGQSLQRFKVQLPDIPPRGSSVRLVSRSGRHNNAT